MFLPAEKLWPLPEVSSRLFKQLQWTFLSENSNQLLIVNYFLKKSSIKDSWQAAKYAPTD